MNEHDHFKEMCALYAGGLGTDAELREFEEHLVNCSDCHVRVSDFMAISAQALAPRMDGRVPNGLPPKGMLERFIETLRKEGVAASKPVRIWMWPAFSLRFAVFAGGAALVAMAAILLAPEILRYLGPRSPHDASVALASRSDVKNVPGRLEKITPQDSSPQKQEADQLRAELASTEASKESLERKNSEMEGKLQSTAVRDEQFAGRINGLERDNQALKQEQQKTEALIASLGDQLKKKDTDELDTVATLGDRQTRIDDLTAKLAGLNTQLAEQKRLLDASSQARDLIIARNLHIVDVHDNIGAEHRQRAFGRIFFTEGKSLVFYAYDLADPGNLNAKVTFHLWGENLEGEQHPKKLGIFRSEDPSQGRWVLTFDDPKVLARVNTVFVTAESAKKDIDQPKGKRILFAFLGAEPNHP